MLVEVNRTHLGGRPRVPGTRLAVGMLAQMVQAGTTQAEILADWPYIDREWLEGAWGDLLEVPPYLFGYRTVDEARELGSPEPQMRVYQDGETWSVAYLPSGEVLVCGITEMEARAIARAIHGTDDDGTGWRPFAGPVHAWVRQEGLASVVVAPMPAAPGDGGGVSP